MQAFKKTYIVIYLIFIIGIICCNKKPKSNEFNVYINEDDPGWHFIDIEYDTIKKGFQRLSVKVAKGQMFQTAKIRSAIGNYPIAFLYETGDPIKDSLFWNAGIWTDKSNKKTIIFYYLPSILQKGYINKSNRDSINNALYYEMDSIIQSYLNKKISN